MAIDRNACWQPDKILIRVYDRNNRILKHGPNETVPRNPVSSLAYAITEETERALARAQFTSRCDFRSRK